MNALKIYQEALDVVSSAILAGDFARYSEMIDLPYLVRTETADLVVNRVEDLRPTFDALHSGLAARGVSNYERVARTADFARPDRIEGFHQTHLISDGEFVVPSWHSGHVLALRRGRWRISEATYRIRGSSWPMSDSMLFEGTQYPEPTEARP